MGSARVIDADEFSAWRDNNVTQAVFRALDRKVAEAKATWLRASWEAGNCDERVLSDLRARSEICQDIKELTFEELEAILDEE